MKIEFAKSLSGHDTGQIYLIWKKEGRFAYLVDGRLHTIKKPKKKSEKHYQIVKHIPESILTQFEGHESLTDDVIRRAVKSYERLKINK